MSQEHWGLSAPTISKSMIIYWGELQEKDGITRLVRFSKSPGRDIPDSAPQEVKDLAAQHWTPEVIAAAKKKYENHSGIPANPISS